MTDLAGLLLVDKPAGLSSHDVVNRVRRAAGQRRVGHAGTLDPLATGLLLLGLGRATRLIEYLVGLPKTYEAVVRLGQSTTTYDAEGTVTAERPVTVDAAGLAAVLDRFRGEIDQVPPMYSAVKQAGRPLYELARQGLEVERPPRRVTIYALQLLAWQPPDASLRIHCSSGTYVRSLAHDLGEAVGSGGYLAGLRRTAVGPYAVAQAIPLADLRGDNIVDHLRPVDAAVSHLPRLDLPEADAARLRHGQSLTRQPDQPGAPLVRAYDPEGNFIGVVAAEGQQWRPRKILDPAG